MRYSLPLTILLTTLALPALGHAQSRDPSRNKQPDFKQPSDEELNRGNNKKLVDLRPKFRKGETIRFTMNLESKSKTTIPALDDKPQEALSTHELGLVFKVKDVTDDGVTIELTFSRIKATRKTTDENEKFDSSQPPAKDKASTMGPQLRALAGTTLTLTLDKDGNVSNIDGGDALMALAPDGGASGSLPGGLAPPSTSGAPPGSPGNAGGGSGFGAALGSIFNIKKGSGMASVGEEWTNSDSLNSGLLGSFTITDKNKLKSFNGSDAVVTVTGFIAPGSGGNESLSIVKIKDSSFAGDYTWSVREGMLRKMNLHQHVVIETGGSLGATMIADTKSTVTRSN